MNIVLFEPEIPQNTGNIVRTCAATGAKLHLIEPLGFVIDDSKLKRAGLDYWYLVDISIYKSLEDFYEKNQGRYFYITTKGVKLYSEITYKKDDYLIFGKETAGLPKAVLENNRDSTLRIPMVSESRSLNLANSVSLVLYETLRQQGFPGMK